MGYSKRTFTKSIVFLLIWSFGCGEKLPADSPVPCAPSSLHVVTGEKGFAQVFTPDPIVSSRNLNLSPSVPDLDPYRSPAFLDHLTGEGILKGKYAQVVDGLTCQNKFRAFDIDNNFSYSHSDSRFQEAMAYYFGDSYQTSIDKIGYLISKNPVTIVAHCELQDNAFFVREQINGENQGQVCLGDSVSMPGAFYGDDGVVTVHELQHSTTIDNYSLTKYINQFWYDEAGALNEAISDFAGLIYVDALLKTSSQSPVPIDLRIFSRWALGTFKSETSRPSNHARGAHRCPQYDSSYPNCGQFPTFGAETVSYIYPDGLGWPYADNYSGTSSSLQAYRTYPSQEEIHNAGVLMEGALWDIYEAIKANHNGDTEFTKNIMMRLVVECIRNLPQPNEATNASPVTFIGFSENLVTLAAKFRELTGGDVSAIKRSLTARGLYSFSSLQAGWMDVGSGTNYKIGTTPTPGVFIQDNPVVLQNWLNQIGASINLVTQSAPSGVNSKLDPGEVVAIWFDIQNNSDLTAGGVLVTATSSDPDLTFLDKSVNVGYLTQAITNSAQVRYGKINGRNITQLLNSGDDDHAIPLGNSYFKTNPFFNRTWRTALWAKVSREAAHGKVIEISVQAAPSNGAAGTQVFRIAIN